MAEKKTTKINLLNWLNGLNRLAFHTETSVTVELSNTSSKEEPDVNITFFDKEKSNFTISLYLFTDFKKNKEYVDLAEDIIERNIDFERGRIQYGNLRGF